jgi:hypothetical protein
VRDGPDVVIFGIQFTGRIERFRRPDMDVAETHDLTTNEEDEVRKSEGRGGMMTARYHDLFTIWSRLLHFGKRIQRREALETKQARIRAVYPGLELELVSDHRQERIREKRNE